MQELMSFDVAPQQYLYTKAGVAVTVQAIAQIKLKSDPESILTASEQERSRLAPFATPPNRRRFSVRGRGHNLASSNDLTETPCTDGLYIVLDLYVSSSV